MRIQRYKPSSVSHSSSLSELVLGHCYSGKCDDEYLSKTDEQRINLMSVKIIQEQEPQLKDIGKGRILTF